MVVSIDKASNNVVVICKQYYVEKILKEIRVIEHGNKTYCKVNKSSDELLDM